MPFHFSKRTAGRQPVTTVGFSRPPTYSFSRSRAAREAAVTLFRSPFLQKNSTIARPGYHTQELKSFDQIVLNSDLATFSSTTLPSGSEPGVAFTGFTCINEIQQGTTFYQRVGTKVTMTSVGVDISLSVQPNVNATVLTQVPTSGIIRFSLVYDRQTNGAYPQYSDIFAVNDQAPLFNSRVNIMNRSRFLVIRDQYLDFDTAQALTHSIHLYAKGRWDEEFGTNSATIGEIRTGAIYLVVVPYLNTDQPAPNIAFNSVVSRVRYLD